MIRKCKGENVMSQEQKLIILNEMFKKKAMKRTLKG